MKFGFLFFISLNLSAQISPKIDSLRNLSNSLANSSEKIRITQLIGLEYVKKHPDSALNYFHRAIGAGKKIGEKRYTASTYSQLALLHNRMGNTDSVSYYLQKTQFMAEKYPSEVDIANYYQTAGLIYKSLGEYEEAKTIFKKQIKLLEASKGDQLHIAGAYHNLSSVYWLLKKMNQAIETEYKALELFKASGSDAGIAYASTTLGNLYYDLGQNREAIKHHLYSLEIKEKMNDKRGMANSYLNLSTAYLSLKEFDKALDYVAKCINLNKGLKLKPEQIKYLWQTAIIYEEKRDTLTALSAYDKAINLAEETQNSALSTEIKKNKERLLPEKIKEKNVDELLNQLDFYRIEKDSANVVQALKDVSHWYRSHNNFKEAYQYQQEYYEMQKSMYGPEVLNRMKQLETKYEISQRENTIALLKKENEVNENKLARRQIALYGSGGIILLTLITTYLFFTRNRILQENKRLVELERIRNEIARDLHDDIGSTISSIQIISELIRKKTEDNQKLFRAAGHISELSGKVSMGLREIIWATNPQNDILEAIVREMHACTTQIEANSSFTFSYREKIKDSKLIIDSYKRKNILMIFKESINNACKYSGATAIEITISQNKRRLKLKISDSGKGFNAEQQTTGNGLINMKNRAAEIGGILTINSAQNAGTSIELRIPLP